MYACINNLFITVELTLYNDQIKKGNASTFKKVFQLLFPSLVNYALHFHDDKMLAEEMVQEAFLLLWEKRERIDASFNMKAYLFKTIHNQALNHIRHKKVVSLYRQNNQQQIVIENHDDPLLTEAIHDAVNSLSPRVKLVFELSKIKGYKNKEIAEELAISIKTVEVQLRNAKLSLQKLLKPYYKNL